MPRILGQPRALAPVSCPLTLCITDKPNEIGVSVEGDFFGSPSRTLRVERPSSMTVVSVLNRPGGCPVSRPGSQLAQRCPEFIWFRCCRPAQLAPQIAGRPSLASASPGQSQTRPAIAVCLGDGDREFHPGSASAQAVSCATSLRRGRPIQKTRGPRLAPPASCGGGRARRRSSVRRRRSQRRIAAGPRPLKLVFESGVW